MHGFAGFVFPFLLRVDVFNFPRRLVAVGADGVNVILQFFVPVVQETVIDGVIVHEPGGFVSLQNGRGDCANQRFWNRVLGNREQSVAHAVPPRGEKVALFSVGFRQKTIVPRYGGFNLAGGERQTIRVLLRIGAGEKGGFQVRGNLPKHGQGINIALGDSALQMRRHILRERVVRLLNVTRNIQIPAVLFEDFIVPHKPRISRYAFLIVERADNLFNVLFPEAVFISVLLISPAGVNHENAVSGFRVLLVDNHDTGRDSRPVKEIRGEADNAFNPAFSQHGEPDGFFRVPAKQNAVRHDDSRFSVAVERFQHMEEPREIPVFFRRNAVIRKSPVRVGVRFQAVAPRLVRKRRIHDDKVKPPQLAVFVRILRVGQRVASLDERGFVAVQDKIHLRKSGGGRVFLLTVNRDDRFSVGVYGGFVRGANQEASASGGGVMKRPLLIDGLPDFADANQLRNYAGNLAGRVKLPLAFPGFLRELHHEVFVSIADDVVAAGDIVLEIERGVLKHANQAGHFIDQFLSGTQLVRIIETDIREIPLQVIAFQKFLDNFVSFFANIWIAPQLRQVVERRARSNIKFREPFSLVSVRDIFEEQENQHIVLVSRRLHAAAQLIARPQQSGVQL